MRVGLPVGITAIELSARDLHALAIGSDGQVYAWGYNAEGQLTSGSFMDYGMPHAHTLPSFKTQIVEVLSPTNPFGIKAGGEGGTTPALSAVVNAILDATWALGVRDITMPATPYRVWQAIQDARTG